jgi:hypothetical protein
MLTLVTAATDFSLLTTTELRRAVNVLDGSQDSTLADLGRRAALVIAGLCKVARAGIAEPTIMQETVAQTIRLECAYDHIVTSRRFISAIVSITVDGTALTTAGYEFNSVSGIIHRLSDDKRVYWDAGKVVATYTAGFAAVPMDVKMAAAKLVSGFYADSMRDPTLKRERVEGVGDFEYFGSQAAQDAVPMEVKQILKPYMTRPGFVR